MDIRERFYRYAIVQEGCWGWRGRARVSRMGYAALFYKGRAWGAHRISYLIHRGEIPPGMCVLHSCDNPICTNPEHLHLGTKQDNTREMMERNRHTKRGCNPNSNNQIRKRQIQLRRREKEILLREILEKRAQGAYLSEIAKWSGYTVSGVSRIVNRNRLLTKQVEDGLRQSTV